MASPPRSQRLFVALYPDAETQARLAEGAGRLGLGEGRPVPQDQIHLTALFIGAAASARVRSIWESVVSAASGCGPVELEALGWALVPKPEAARLLAVGTPTCPRNLAELVRRLAQRLGPPGAGGQTFWPHLTLWRFSGPRPVAPPATPLGVERLCCGELALVESQLTKSGAQHRRLATLPLAPPGR
jgi:RNA 2',3'-cyclic 3'-phosphodiesterase